MADFDPPFADQGERRLPTTTEQQLGFPCGPASRELFNGLFWLLQGQIKDIASEAGVIPSQEGDITLLKRAVLALIDAATGGGTADNYILMDQARSRLPFYPDVQHETGHLGVLSPSTGAVRVPGGRTFLHRGILPVTTVQTDFVTDPSKTYHLRWNPTDGFVLRDLASGTYNPGTLAETDKAFDSSYDDMLVARLVTNSSNVVTVTNLINKDRLTGRLSLQGQNWRQGALVQERVGDFSGSLNWARTPKTFAFSVARHYSSKTTTAGDSDLYIVEYGGSHLSPMLDAFPFNRYETKFSMLHDDWDTTLDVIYDVSFGA